MLLWLNKPRFFKDLVQVFFSFSVIVNDELRNEWDFPLENFKEIGECRKNNRTTLSLKRLCSFFLGVIFE